MGQADWNYRFGDGFGQYRHLCFWFVLAVLPDGYQQGCAGCGFISFCGRRPFEDNIGGGGPAFGLEIA